ncbi:hypothetical protein LCGC14_3089350 [marine sediment metagenome]|uniref:Uncharacterized protein n=1 Tax=marine sediment metagenome TaxID=412755 RepID=A0A0F8Z1I4_9ZZZZ
MSDVLNRETFVNKINILRLMQPNEYDNQEHQLALFNHDTALREQLEAAKTMFKEVWKALGESDKDLEQSQTRVTALEGALMQHRHTDQCLHYQRGPYCIAPCADAWRQALAEVQEISNAKPTT